MRSAIYRVDIVGEREDLLVVTVVVLQRDIDRERVFGRAGEFFEIDRLRMKHVLVLIQVLNKFGDAAFVKELVFLLGVGALVNDRDRHAFVEECFFTQAF